MKALKVRGGALEVLDLDPPVPGVNDVVVDVVAVGLSAADLAAASDSNVVPGRRFAGKVAAVGHAVTGFKVGDIVVSAPPGSCGQCGACLRGADAYCARADVLYAGIRPGVDTDGGLAEQACVAEIFLAPSPEADMAALALAGDIGIRALHAIRAAGDAITVGNRVTVLGSSALADYTRALLENVAGVQLIDVADYSVEAQQRLLEKFAPDGITAALVMDRTQEACDCATAITTTGGAVVLADNGTGVATVQPMPLMRYEASVISVAFGNRADLIELLRLLAFRPIDVEHRRVCLDEFASFDSARLSAIEPGLVVVA